MISQVPVHKEALIKEYVQYPQRWFQLFLFICALTSNIFFGFPLSPIVDALSVVYDVNSKFLQFLVVSFTIFSAIMIIPGNILSEKYGIRSNIAIGCALTLVGAIFSMFISYSFWFLYFGQLISLVGFPFRLISISKFTANWFFPHTRIIIMVFITLLYNASSGLSIRLPLWILGDYDYKKDPDPTYAEGKQLIQNLVYFNGYLMLALCIPPILFFKSAPPTPPSFTASDECKRENYLQAGVKLLQNKDYLYLTGSFSFLLGTVLLLTIQMEQIVTPFGFDLSDISNAIGCGVIAGLCSDLIIGGIVKKTGKYKTTFRTTNALCTIFFVFLIISLLAEKKTMFFIFYALVCGSSSVLALTFELACEISFPVSENSTIAILGLMANLINFIQAIPEALILYFKDKASSIITLLIMLTFISFANVLGYKVNENLKRLKIDEIKEAIPELTSGLLSDKTDSHNQSLQGMEQVKEVFDS